MTCKDHLFLLLAGVLVAALGLIFQSSPGYMDADYYFVNGQQLAQGNGFNEPFVWNYLDEPTRLPHPSHLYWMPLTSMLAALGMLVSGAQSFTAARLIFLLFAAILPVCCGSLAFKILQDRRKAFLTGVFALIPGFYLPYLGITDVFSPTMILGIGFISLSVAEKSWLIKIRPFLLGFFAGLMHLARADGILWLAAAMGVVLYLNAREKQPVKKWFIPLVLVVLGYVVLMGPWYARNLHLFGSLFVPGSSRAMWILSYEETFSYPAAQLTAKRWLESGWIAILSARGTAFLSNLKTFVGVQSSVILLPFILLGGWKLRKTMPGFLTMILWLMFFLLMSIVFPFAGARGGFFHSAAAIQPMLWVLASEGFFSALSFGARLRRWNLAQSQGVFGTAMIVILIAITAFVTYQNILAPVKNGTTVWETETRKYQEVGDFLTQLGVREDQVVMVNNPATFTAVTGRSSIAVPLSSISNLQQLADRFRADILVLEDAHVSSLDSLYRYPTDNACCKLLGSIDGIYIFQIIKD